MSDRSSPAPSASSSSISASSTAQASPPPPSDVPTLARRVVLASALYDLVVTAPFATPWTARHALSFFDRLHHQLGLAGAPPVLDGPVALLFANLLGSIVVVWSIVRLAAPTARNGAADTAGRILFSSWMLFALTHEASPVLIGFLVPEVLWGVVQGGAVALWSQHNNGFHAWKANSKPQALPANG